MSPKPAPARARRTHRAAALFGGLIMVAVLAGPAALAGTPLGRAALGSTGCASAADARVGLAIDFGDQLSAVVPPPTWARCGAPGGNGIQLLVTTGHSVRLSQSGLVCAIDGYPNDTDCGRKDGTQYDYWSYWYKAPTATTWAYSGVGPAGRTPGDGEVDGWHFVRGGGNPHDPPPRVDPTTVCPAVAPPTVPPTTGPAGGGAANPRPATVPPHPGAAPGVAGNPTPPTAVSGSGPGDIAAASPTPSTVTADGPGGAGGADVANGPGGEQADGAAPGARSAASSPGVPVAVVVVIVAIAALGLAAGWRLRARPED